MIDKKLLAFCNTDYQTKCIKTILKFSGSKGQITRAAEDIGISVNAMKQMLFRIKVNAAKRGYSPGHDMTRTCPENFAIKGTSTLYDDSGNVKIQWVKTDLDKEKQAEAMRLAIDELKHEVPKLKPVKSKGKDHIEDYLNLYTFTDYHLGMFAWDEESGDHWDRDIAVEAFEYALLDMIERSPEAKIGMLNIQGDFLHTDGMTPVTPANRHVLDADTRYQKLIRDALRIIRKSVVLMQEKHKKVILLIAEGNHDESGSKWLQELFRMYYSECANIEVIVSPSPYYCITHGSTLLAFHHGHKADVSKFSQIVPAQFSKQWGRTKYRYGHIGHRHHKQVKEGFGMIVEQHQTLAAKDAHAARGGYFSERGATSITYSKKHGESSRITVRPRGEK